MKCKGGRLDFDAQITTENSKAALKMVVFIIIRSKVTAAFLARCESSQIQTRTLLGEEKVCKAKLVASILTYKSRLKTRKLLCFHHHQIGFVRKVTVQYSLLRSWLDVSRLRFKRGRFLVKKQYVRQSWSPRF